MKRCVSAIRVLALVAALGAAAGCETPVLVPDEPRSQYDRFDAIRDQRAPSYVYDEFGARRPNIRQRLLTGQ
ncbi:MAG: hypothetical protein WCK33_03005 [Phycisphaerae bacterium]|jgi:hypothetical protein